MKIAAFLVAAIALGLMLATAPAASLSRSASPPELEYLEVVNQRPQQDLQLPILLMGQYLSARQQERGIAFFSARLKEFDHQFSELQKAVHLSALAVLRAQHAADVPLWQRLGYVKDTIGMIEESKRLTHGEVFVVNWMAGMVDTKLPGFFGRRDAARAELNWCVEHAGKAPQAGWMREVYRHQALLAEDEGNTTAAQRLLKLSGYPDLHLPITLLTPFSEEAATGHRFAPRQIKEVVPHRVYALTGFEFTDYYFVVSENGHELIGIDAGTRPDSAKLAYEALRAYAPGLPSLTTVFVTHSHWDHVGGQAYFRSLRPQPRFYARSNFHAQLDRDLAAPASFDQSFFGSRYKEEDVRTFKPDVLVEGKSELLIDGTRISLIPVQGGETDDAMLIHVPELHVLFVGDIVMPYIGAPFAPEGNLPGMASAIDVVAALPPALLLHGHAPLTENFPSAAVLSEVKADLMWLREQVQAAVRKGTARAAIHTANLIPPALRNGVHHDYLPYLVFREHVIDRAYAQSAGYWQADLQGMDHLGPDELAAMLGHYLELPESRILSAARKMIEDGKYELAAHLLEIDGERVSHNAELAALKRLAYMKLMEKYQNHDPFKFIVYASKARLEVPPMPVAQDPESAKRQQATR
ncbi:MAG: MBL fold metallo-hydrolase [Pseudomonadota bacterium]